MILSFLLVTKMRIKTPSLHNGVRTGACMESSEHGVWHVRGAYRDGTVIQKQWQ